MSRRYFNWKLAIVLLVGFVVLGVTAYGLRQWRRSSRSEQGLVLGNKAYDEHRYEEAALQLGRYLSVESKDVPILLKYASAHINIRPLKSNNINQAIAAYRVVLREDKSNSEAAMRLTELYFGIGAFGQAEFIARKYLETNQDLKLRRLLALALVRQGKFDEAAMELKSIIVENPGQILAYETFGHLIEQRPEDFLNPPDYWFNEAVKKNPSSPLAYIIRADFLLRNNDKSKALTDLEQAEKLDLSDPIVRLRLAESFINANVFDKAEQNLEAARVADPKNQALWRIWATLVLKSNLKEKMLKVAETGLKELAFMPWDFMPIAAELYIRCDELDRAGDCILKLSEKDIAPLATAFLKGILADKQGRLFEAAKCFRRAIESDSKSPKVRLALASVLSRSGDTRSALRQLRILVSEWPNFLDGRLALARLFAKNRNWADTAEQAQKAIQISPNSLDAALLHIQARIQLLAESQTDKDSLMWREIEDNLAGLVKASEDAFPVKALQFQLAFSRSQFGKAEQLLHDMKNSYPSRMEVAMAEAELLAAQDRSDEAIVKLYDVVSAFPKSISPLRRLAILLESEGRAKECEKLIKDALIRLEQLAAKREVGLLLTSFYRRWNEHEKCYLFLDSFARDLQDDILVQRELLKCEKVLKDYDRAQQLVNRIKSIEGEDGWQWRYEQARIYFTQDNFNKQYSEIVSLLKDNLRISPDDQASRMLLVAAYERAGQSQLAISHYRDAYNRSPHDLHIIVAYVNALFKVGEYDRADEILRRVDKEKLFHPGLEKLKLRDSLRRGELRSAIEIMENLLANDPNDRSVCLSLALLKTQQNKFAEAEELLSKLKIQEPDSLPITVAQIELNVRQGKSDEAIELCDELINNLGNASAYIIRARTFDSLGETDKATVDFDHAITIEPNNVETWVARGDFYRSIGRVDKAIADIQQALSMVPDNVQIQKRIISLLLASNRPDSVLQGKTILDKALTANPEDVELRLYKARSLFTEGTAPAFDNTERILQKITEEQPKVTEAWVLLGEVLMKKGGYREAVNITWRGLAHTPKNKELLLLKFRAEKELSMDLAILTLKLLYEMDINDVDTAVLLADTYVETDEYEKALNLLKKHVVSCSDASDERKVNIALAGVLYQSGDKQQAQKIFESLFQSDPNDPAPLLAYSRLLKTDKLWDRLSRMVVEWCRNHPKDTRTPVSVAVDLMANEDSQAKKTAENLLRKVLDRNTNSLPTMGSLAMLLQVTGRHDESAELYKRILAIQPDNIIAINNLAWILCEEQGKHQEALQLADRGLKIAPNYVDLIDTRGIVYYRRGEYEKAVQDFKTCLRLYPKGTPAMAAAYFHSGRALAVLGQKEEAVGNLNKALELNVEIGSLSAKDTEETQRLLQELSQGS